MLGVVVAIALYFTMMDVIHETPVPEVQLDSYQSMIRGAGYQIALKFGRTGHVWGPVVYDMFENRLTNWCVYLLPDGTWSDKFPVFVVPGSEVIFWCSITSYTSVDSVIVRVFFTDGKVVNIRWIPK